MATREKCDSKVVDSIYRLSVEDKWKLAEEYYESGVSLIKSNRNREAFKMLRQASTLASIANKKDCDLKQKCLSNLTLIQFNLGRFEQVVPGVSYILENCPDSSNKAKLIARRGRAQMKLNNYEAAIADFNEVMNIDANFPNAMADINTAKKLRKEHDQKLGSALKKMFN